MSLEPAELILEETTTELVVERATEVVEVLCAEELVPTTVEQTLELQELTILEVTPDVVEILEIGIPGPVGPEGAPGPSTEEGDVLAKRVDFEAGETVIYIGFAQPGTLDSAALWQIRRETIINVEGDLVREWADGDTDFDNIWDDRASLSYS